MTDKSTYIEVAVALPVYKIYAYKVPADFLSMVGEGKRVLVPFGNRKVTGYIISYIGKPEREEIKDILDVLDEHPLFPVEMIPFFQWASDYYMHPIGEVIKGALPGGINLYDTASFSITEKGLKALSSKKIKSPLEKKVLEALKRKKTTLTGLRRKIKKDVPGSLFYRMELKGIVSREVKIKGTQSISRTERFVSMVNPDIPRDRFFEKRKEIIDTLEREGEISVKTLEERISGSTGYIKFLEREKYISVTHKRVFRDPLGESVQSDTPPVLTNEQEKAVEEIAGSLGKGFRTFLLSGVTGSGKTEVYMRLAEEAIKQGRTAIVLVPEISLISQTERRFRARFGDCVAVLHSGLTRGERYDQWSLILRGEVDIVIGARSAVFAPFVSPGIIIVDEEHDTSYKQETGLRYNARDLAVMRAKLENITALLGSATPSIQSSYNATIKKFTEITLKKRVKEQQLPNIRIVDLREYRDARGIKRFITPELVSEMKRVLDRGEQVLLFLNRRGFSSFPICAACEEVMKCDNCNISLTLHKQTNAYRCHFCGFFRAAASTCRACGSSKIQLLGMGTEKVEEAVKALFPEAAVARLDRDTTSRKGSIIRILRDLREGRIEILIGTQMVTKGHDFPNITLVGIVCADMSLNFPDFRAGERTFQILAQVAGRAGRGKVPGQVFLQTYTPEHFSITAAKDQDYKQFYKTELGFRKALKYPPFSRIIHLKISGRDRKETRELAENIGERSRNLMASDKKQYNYMEMLGPVEAPMAKKAGRYRWQLLLKCIDVTLLHRFVRHLMFDNRKAVSRRAVRVVIDVDPFIMM